ncbi:40S ribosomal protein S2 [Microtus ochrogaster]|uniref:40S ribosomal protein S2 n=1 Tax=Microtus ochrogaster TaxID=79684 RepID=A0A8J6H117_MICOH|nr:40S ribosomal protein S2 [Microtus ochrogaster]
MKFNSLEEIYLFSLLIKESEIIESPPLGMSLKDEVLKIMPLLMMTSIYDCYTLARGCTATLSNFVKATFDAISKTYSYLTPNLWKETVFTKSP